MSSDLPIALPTLAELTEKALADLEWEHVLARLAVGCSSDVAAQRLVALRPEVERAAAMERAARVRDTLALLDEGERLPVQAVPDLAELLERVSRGGEAAGEELVAVRRVLGVARGLRALAHRFKATHPALCRALMTSGHLDTLLVEYERCFEQDGSLTDAASSALRELRERVQSHRAELRRRIGALMAAHQDVLQDQFWTERDGRFVLPVRSDSHGRIDGLVLGSSASGSTLYVEPRELTPLANRMRVAAADVEREEARLLSVLTGKLRHLCSEVGEAFEATVEADMLAAIARWALLAEARPFEPLEEPVLDARVLRHPLLIDGERKVIPNDVPLGAGTALVISGPNAGGKTVALKSAGLAALLVRTGLPVPADERSRFGWFDLVLADVGDAQSLAKSLSTFSAHVAQLAALLELAGRGALVLLDEVAGGTDPEEGGALAASVLEELVARGAAVAVTTHYERLKELAATRTGFRNASVGFDLTRLLPSFRLVLDLPGPSSALAVARRFGVPARVIEQARDLLPKSTLEREALISKLKDDLLAATAAREATEDDARKMRAARLEFEKELEQERERERARLSKQSVELVQAVRSARAVLERAGKRLESDKLDSAALRELEREVSGAAKVSAVGSALHAATRKSPPPGEAPLDPATLVPGARVFLTKLQQYGEVVEPPSRGSVRVRAGVFTLAVPVEELRRAPPGAVDANKSKPRKVRLPEPEPAAVFMRNSDNTLDLRGERVEDALGAVDVFIERMLRDGESAGYVLHGHGTGALKLAVRSHLNAHRMVERAEPANREDGGDALTLVHLKR